MQNHSNPSEQSPLLLSTRNLISTKQPSFPLVVLGELIGARHLSGRRHQPFCIVRYGSRVVHRTKPGQQSSGIWTIRECSLFLIEISENDARNNKAVELSVWGRRMGKLRSRKLIGLGKVRIKTVDLLSSYCTEERIEHLLEDDLGQLMPRNKQGFSPKIALRFRVASKQDTQFVQTWENIVWESRVPQEALKGTGVLPEEGRLRAHLVTEQDERPRPSSTLLSSLTGKDGVRVKPCPNPKCPSQLYMRVGQLKASTSQPSSRWIDAGSGNLGKLYVEVLSCHDLPNVDFGNAVGNATDAFCSIVYGDVAVQTDVIRDELSPHWLPWTQRAFSLSILHPSNMLYVAVFGFKEGALFPHVPIGRIEINPIQFEQEMEYTLFYQLSKTSHATHRSADGTIRLRLRVEWSDQRSRLMASLKSPPPLYINSKRRKTYAVERYTACGEHDDDEKFRLSVLLAYINEMKDGFLRRIVWGIGDATVSLVLWRGQVTVMGYQVPLHSLSTFAACLLVVENPCLVPGVLSLSLAYLMLVNLQLRKQYPSPWHRCISYWHYFSLMVFGDNRWSSHNTIRPREGYTKQKEMEETLAKRLAEDAQFAQKKEVIEKEIEAVENTKVETKSRSAVVPVELLVVLGKLQGILGGIVRFCRSIDLVVTWEKSDASFCITTFFIIVGILFLFIPWGLLIVWTARVTVVALLGPQNKLIDIFVIRRDSEEHRMRKMFQERIFRARMQQEEAVKLRALRHILFGKFSAFVPPISWTPHLYRPLPESFSTSFSGKKTNMENARVVPGQKLFGNMIPRPLNEWKMQQQSLKTRTKAAVTSVKQLRGEKVALRPSNSMDSAVEQMLEEGVEVLDLFDLETPLPSSARRRSSETMADIGVEITNEYEDEENFVSQDFATSNDSELLVLSDDDRGVNDEDAVFRRASEIKGDWGVEVMEEFHDEADFVSRFRESPTSELLSLSDDSSEEQESDSGALVARNIPQTMSEFTAGSRQMSDSNQHETVQLLQADLGASQQELGFEIVEHEK